MGIEKKPSSVNRKVVVVLAIMVVALLVASVFQLSVLLVGTSKTCTKKACLAKFLEGPPAFNDPDLKSFLRRKFFVQSSGPAQYELKVGYDNALDSTLDAILKHFNHKRDGTFAVFGAGDGEFKDLTLPLEHELQWSGLLVEPHPTLFKILKDKGRRSLLSSNCVSPVPRPRMFGFSHEAINDADSSSQKLAKFHRAKITNLVSENDTHYTEQFKAQCVPIENLLYAAELDKQLDLLVLDMSGTDTDLLSNSRMDLLPNLEMAILRTHGADVAIYAQGFFLDKNMVVDVTFESTAGDVVYIYKKFKGKIDLE